MIHTHWRRKQDVWRLVKQLQPKRKLHNLRNKFGHIIQEPEALAAEIVQYWQQTMRAEGAPVLECKRYLSQFFSNKNMPLMVSMLVRSPTQDLVEAALDGLSKNSAPGADGAQASIYSAFREFFLPLMHDIYQHILNTGELNPEWSQAILNPIPKALGSVGVADLRPLVLQNCCHKWTSAILLLQLQDPVSAVTPMHQSGFIKGRYIQNTVWQAFDSWSSMTQGCFVPIDFQKAFDSVTHAYAQAFFEMMTLPADVTRLLVALFTAHIIPVIHGIPFKHYPINPTSGVRQGCPLSPSMFAMLISPLALKLTAISPHVSILLYADDLLIIITLPPDEAHAILMPIMTEMSCFTAHTGLKMNKGKSAILLKGEWPPQLQAALTQLGIPIQKTYKYLGILLGHVTPEQSFSLALNKALGRAYSMRSWELSLPERIELLKLWILPLLVHPARAVFADDNVISTLTLIYHVSLRLNSWGITQPILSLPKQQGGYALPAPKEFLHWQFSTLFARFLNNSSLIPSTIVSGFQPFQIKHGIVLDTTSTFTFQMGSNVVWNTMPYLAWSARAFSLLKQHIPQAPLSMLAYDTPLWHHHAFCNQHNQTYYCPQLIRAGILTVGSLREDDSLFSRLAPSWQPIYRAAIQRLATSQPPLPPAYPDRYPELPDRSHWVKWIDTKLLSYVSYPYDFEPRQEQKVWKAWWRCNLPSDLKDFVHAALWQRLPVGHRQANWKPLETCCPLDGSLETVRHSLLHCRYLPVAYDTIAKCFPDWGSGVLGIQRLIDSEPDSSLQTPVGILAWTAIYASWLVRCTVKFHPEARHTFQFFLKRWVVVLRSLAQARCYTVLYTHFCGSNQTFHCGH